MDRHFADWIRKQGIPAALIANKCESKVGIAGMYEAYELGLGEPIAISAEHGQGLGELCDLLRPHVDKEAAETQQDEAEAEISRNISRFIKGAEIGFGDQEDTGESNT